MYSRLAYPDGAKQNRSICITTHYHFHEEKGHFQEEKHLQIQSKFKSKNLLVVHLSGVWIELHYRLRKYQI